MILFPVSASRNDLYIEAQVQKDTKACKAHGYCCDGRGRALHTSHLRHTVR